MNKKYVPYALIFSMYLLAFSAHAVEGDASKFDRQNLIQKNNKCLAIKDSKIRSQCLTDLQKEFISYRKKRSDAIRKNISNKERFKQALKERDKLYEKTKNKTPRW